MQRPGLAMMRNALCADVADTERTLGDGNRLAARSAAGKSRNWPHTANSFGPSCENQHSNMAKAFPFSALPTADLLIDAVYEGAQKETPQTTFWASSFRAPAIKVVSARSE